MGIICDRWPLDGSQKTFGGNVAWRTGTHRPALPIKVELNISVNL